MLDGKKWTQEMLGKAEEQKLNNSNLLLPKQEQHRATKEIYLFSLFPLFFNLHRQHPSFKTPFLKSPTSTTGPSNGTWKKFSTKSNNVRELNGQTIYEQTIATKMRKKHTKTKNKCIVKEEEMFAKRTQQ